jgi:hypothetical protein
MTSLETQSRKNYLRLLSQLFYRLFEFICIKCTLNALEGTGAEPGGLKIMDSCKTTLKKRSTNFSAREETLLPSRTSAQI